MWVRSIRSCGRFGPATLGSMVARSSFQGGGVLRVGGVVGAEESLLAGDPFDPLDHLGAAAGAAQIGQRLRVDREEAHRCPVLGGHVGQGGLVGKGQPREPGTVVLHEATHDAVPAQQLRDPQHQVGRGRPFGQRAGQLHAHHLGEQHVVRLPQQHRLRLDPPDPPAHHAQSVDHRGVGIGPHDRVRIREEGPSVLAPVDDRRQVLQVDLVHDPGSGRHHAVVLEGLLGPAQQGVALPVALVLARHILLEGVAGPEEVDLHGVVDDQVGRHQRADARRVAAHLADAVPHGGQVHDRGHAGEVLQDDPGGHEGEVRARVGRAPGGYGFDVFGGHIAVARVAQHILEEDPNGKGEAVERGETFLLQAAQAVEGGGAFGEVDGGEGAEGIGRTRRHAGTAPLGVWKGKSSKG